MNVMDRKRIRIISNLARAGGTLVARCVGSQENVVLLSEIHPLGCHIHNPLLQAQEWYKLFGSEKLHDQEYTFLETIELIVQHCQERQKELVIRDWAHLDFIGIPFLKHPGYRLQLTEILSQRYDVLQYALVRHPIDQWLSTSNLGIMQGQLNLDAFLCGYRHFAEQCASTGFMRYEDFVNNPVNEMRMLCEHLEIDFDDEFMVRWADNTKVTGDVSKTSRGSKFSSIIPLPRKPIDRSVLERFLNNADYWYGIKLLGYENISESSCNPDNMTVLLGSERPYTHSNMKSKSSPSLPEQDGEPELIRQLLNEGVQHSKAGQFDEALKYFQQVLEHKPNDADALHLSGVVAANRGKFEEAKSLIGKAITIKPHEAVFHLNLGNALLDEGQIEQAMQSLSEALRLQPGDTDILNKLTLACDRRYAQATGHYSAEEFDEADAACRQILDIRPDRADAWHLWGVVASARGDPHTGLDRIHRAMAIAPDKAHFHNALGVVLGRQGRHRQAAECYKRAIKLDSGYTEAHANLALALHSLGHLEAAIASFQKVNELDPGNDVVLIQLSNVFREMGKHDEAVAAAQQAVDLAPDNARSYGQLAIALRSLSRTTEAIQACQRSLELDPDDAVATNTLAQLLKDQGRIKKAHATYRKALRLDPDNAVIHSNVLFNLHYSESLDAKAIFSEHRQWAHRHSFSASTSTLSVATPRDPDKRVRVGYVSADLKSHSAAFFFESLLAAYDRQLFEVICYSNSLTADATTLRLQGLADKWRNIAALKDEQAASLIRSDAVDILVDLSGHTSGNRLPLFTRKPAPIQVTYLGYPNTTGIDAMDYRFTDKWADPPGQTEQFHSEQLVRLPDGFLCYRPPASSPEVGPLPMLENGQVTFGSFNNLSKVNPTTVGLWAEILSAIPDSRLLMKSKPLADSGTRKRFLKQFRSHGIENRQIEMIGWTPNKAEHMTMYNKIDIALDTFPYHGATTTCEALWMGVPVITLAGSIHVSRVGVSLLHAAGLDEMIAESPKEYIRKAVELAADPDRLANLRGSLREQLQASPLIDAERITRSIEAAYRRMWQDYCSAEKSNIG
jgi:protein O-GlcNAc transferase